MIDQQISPRKTRANLWVRLVQVDVPLDDEQRRIGALFNSLMIIAVVQTLALSIPLIVAWQRSYFASPLNAAIIILPPLALLPFSLFSYALVKRGHLRWTIPFYVWINLVMVLTTGVVFGGASSVSWFIVLWPIALAGTLMQPADTIRFSIISVFVYMVIAIAENNGMYNPPLQVSSEAQQFLTISFYWITLTVVGAFVNYINVSSLRRAVDTSRETTKLAEDIQAELEDRVATRTATLEHRAEQFQTIAELGKVTSTVREEGELLDTTVKLISRRMSFYHVAIYIIDPSGEWAVLKSANSIGGTQMLSRGYRLRVGQQDVVGYASRTGVPRVAFDVGEDAVKFANPDLPETRSEIALPLTSVNGVFGVLDIQTEDVSAFDEQDVEVLQVLADSVAIAIENTRLLNETKIALDRLERYQEQDAIRAWRYALARRNMQVGYTYQSGLIQAVENKELLQVQPRREDAVVVSVTDSAMHRLTATISVGGHSAGYIAFERSVPWSDETIQLVESVVTQLDLALNNARLLEETRLRASQEAVRSEIVEHVRALTSTDAIMRSAAEELGRALRVERSRIQLVQFNDES